MPTLWHPLHQHHFVPLVCHHLADAHVSSYWRAPLSLLLLELCLATVRSSPSSSQQPSNNELLIFFSSDSSNVSAIPPQQCICEPLSTLPGVISYRSSFALARQQLLPLSNVPHQLLANHPKELWNPLHFKAISVTSFTATISSIVQQQLSLHLLYTVSSSGRYSSSLTTGSTVTSCSPASSFK